MKNKSAIFIALTLISLLGCSGSGKEPSTSSSNLFGSSSAANAAPTDPLGPVNLLNPPSVTYTLTPANPVAGDVMQFAFSSPRNLAGLQGWVLLLIAGRPVPAALADVVLADFRIAQRFRLGADLTLNSTAVAGTHTFFFLFFDPSGPAGQRYLFTDLRTLTIQATTYPSAWNTIQGESYVDADSFGVGRYQNGTVIGDIQDGDWAAYNTLSFSPEVNRVTVRTSSDNIGGTIHFILDDLSGSEIGHVLSGLVRQGWAGKLR